MHLLFGTHINLILLKRSKPCKIAQQDSSTRTTLITAVSPHLNLKLIFLTSNHGAKFPGSAFFTSFITHHLAALLSHQLTAFHAALVIRKLSIPPMLVALRIFFSFFCQTAKDWNDLPTDAVLHSNPAHLKAFIEELF
ncbi:unnamed protein product [Ixodes persulcatus]